MRSLLPAAALSVLGAVPALAADPAYLDDRSSPEVLVRSLYNAIARKEYARAWSYFSDKPAENLAAFAESYADTEKVVVRTGPRSEQETDGNKLFLLPVAIEASNSDGDAQVYGGCYGLELTNPQLQPEDYVALRIVRGRLEPSGGSIDEALPDSCGDAPAIAPTAARQARAEAVFRGAFAEACLTLRNGDEIASESWELPFSYASDRDGDPKRFAWLYRFPCNRGAYNESHVFVIANDYDELSVVGFPAPELDIRYADEDQKKVDVIYVKGAISQTELVNSTFDLPTLTLRSYALWRGLGDAAAEGTWEFREGRFSLSRYDVDASFDEEQNPETVLDYHGGP
ncbi:MAG: DUF1176 domain-containing protein [Rhizobiaceae bacterium]|nr:DUF1176 domain-containing protein [Rhizobiaceae bacterium]